MAEEDENCMSSGRRDDDDDDDERHHHVNRPRTSHISFREQMHTQFYLINAGWQAGWRLVKE